MFFEIASKYCILDSFAAYDDYSISFKGFLPTVVDIMVFELNSPIPVHFTNTAVKKLNGGRSEGQRIGRSGKARGDIFL